MNTLSLQHGILGARFLRTCLMLLVGVVISMHGSMSQAASPCPAIGLDSICGIVITVTDKGATVTFTGQGPYDGIDDTLVGVVNNSKIPVSSIAITSSSDAFGFDGDGICSSSISPRPATCPFGPTGYEGPGTYFTAIGPGATSGVVNFVKPIPTGGTAYFSLEESLTAATTCSTLINNALKTQASGANICAAFTPNAGQTLSQAATACGFVNFDWIQLITVQFDPSAFYARNSGGAFNSKISGPVRLTSKSVPWYDPPQGGGYSPSGGGSTTPDNSYPFYYDASGEVLAHENGNAEKACTLSVSKGRTLTIHDAPADPCLPGGSGVGTAQCDLKAEPKGSYGGYVTHLAGVKSDGSAVDLGIGYTWTSNYNGHTGGISIKKTDAAADGDGTGGVTITSVNNVTNYQYPQGIGVTAINGIPTTTRAAQLPLNGSQITVTSSGLAYSRSSQTFNGTITITNVGDAAIDGPFNVVLSTLTAGVTLKNASSTFAGFPYVTVAASSSLAPGDSTSVELQLSDPSLATINFAPLVYSGGFD